MININPSRFFLRDFFISVDKLKFITPDEPDRFNGHTQSHSHIRCVKCGELTNINIKEITKITKNAEKEYDGQVNNCSIMFYGIYKKCQNIN